MTYQIPTLDQLCPEIARDEMKLYRLGLAPIPQEYIDHHERQAREAIAEIEKTFRVVGSEMRDSGWCDSTQFLNVYVESRRTGKLARLFWHDGNCEFFIKLESGGSTPFRFVSEKF